MNDSNDSISSGENDIPHHLQDEDEDADERNHISISTPNTINNNNTGHHQNNSINSSINNNNNNNNNIDTIDNELIAKQLDRVENHLSLLEEKFKAQDERLLSNETTNQEILVKLNHLTTALESLSNVNLVQQAGNIDLSTNNNNNFQQQKQQQQHLQQQQQQQPVSQQLNLNLFRNLTQQQQQQHQQQPQDLNNNTNCSNSNSSSVSSSPSLVDQLGDDNDNLNDLSRLNSHLNNNHHSHHNNHQIHSSASVSPSLAAMAPALQFLSLFRQQVGDLDLANTLGAAADLTNHLAKQNSANNNNNNNSHHQLNHHQLASQALAHSAASTISSPNSNNNTNPSSRNQLTSSTISSLAAAAAAAAAVQQQQSTQNSLNGSSHLTNSGHHHLHQTNIANQTNGNSNHQSQPPVVSIPHPHSHHALSHPSAAAAAAAASLLLSGPQGANGNGVGSLHNPHYQTVRTKYSTRRYSRRRVGPEEAMADPAIRSTVQLKIPVVPKTILIVLKHRLTVQTAITLACQQTGERLRKGAIQKKLEAMFREPGAVDAFMAEWDHAR